MRGFFGNDTESEATCSAMAKTDIRQIFSCPLKYRVFKDRRVVTDCGEKYEGMPDRVLETQAPPKMKDDTHRIYHAARREKPESQAWERGNDGPVGHHATPTEKKIENNRYVIETPWQHKLQHDANTCR